MNHFSLKKRGCTRTREGFTLIELLVVIAIIAILSVVVVLTINPAEMLRQSRDSQRVSDLNTLRSAINPLSRGLNEPKYRLLISEWL